MNNYFIIGKVNEGKSHLFNLFSKTHKTISNPKANTTIDIIRKNILSENSEYNLYDTPGFYKFTDFTILFNKISELSLEAIAPFVLSPFSEIYCAEPAVSALTFSLYLFFFIKFGD